MCVGCLDMKKLLPSLALALLSAMAIMAATATATATATTAAASDVWSLDSGPINPQRYFGETVANGMIGILSAREIDEHKNYFTRESIQKLTKPLHVKLEHCYFEFGLNNFAAIMTA